MTFIPRPKQQEILAYTGGKMGGGGGFKTGGSF